ncbi:response regulator transcription factor [Sphingomonas dokdonensis]|uniref:Transcriptional regulatory protein FixJ n=1 Tax=Sphingomonas dokdonensis TaxID=344880 RepID=A0A245ZUV9_9SPHN|nr:response regulator [Sphingomonas dokdonensis]OWK33543.1 transcriptional regulatory protein FixJ [Sphingomonas dokdonensis]
MRTIYIVDDDDPVRASLQSLLSVRKNLLIRSFRSGDLFLEQVEELDPGVLLLDFNMPGSNGLDVLRALRPFGNRFVSIVLTGKGSIDVAVQAMKIGAVDFLEKPYDPVVLLQLIDAAFVQHEQQHAMEERTAQAASRIDALSPRERDVLKGLIEGRSNKVIAFELELSPRTVEIYRANLMQKLDVRSLSDALKIAFAAGMFPDA